MTNCGLDIRVSAAIVIGRYKTYSIGEASLYDVSAGDQRSNVRSDLISAVSIAKHKSRTRAP